MSQVTEQSVRFQTALASIKLIQASAVLDLTEDDFDFLTSNKVWIATDRSRARRCVEESWLPCWSDWSSYYHFNYSGYRWRLLRDGRRWRSPSFSIASWPCY